MTRFFTHDEQMVMDWALAHGCEPANEIALATCTKLAQDGILAESIVAGRFQRFEPTTVGREHYVAFLKGDYS